MVIVTGVGNNPDESVEKNWQHPFFFSKEVLSLGTISDCLFSGSLNQGAGHIEPCVRISKKGGGEI